MYDDYKTKRGPIDAPMDDRQPLPEAFPICDKLMSATGWIGQVVVDILAVWTSFLFTPTTASRFGRPPGISPDFMNGISLKLA